MTFLKIKELIPCLGLAVGPESFTKRFQERQNIKARYRSTEQHNDTYILNEPITLYNDHGGKWLDTVLLVTIVFLKRRFRQQNGPFKA